MSVHREAIHRRYSKMVIHSLIRGLAREIREIRRKRLWRTPQKHGEIRVSHVRKRNHKTLSQTETVY